jgi:hypothetical protein
MDGVAAAIYRLPEDCVAHAIAMTTPADACSSSAVSPAFRAAADSDAVWDRFLPRDHAAVLARADDGAHRECSKKELFTRLCSRPVLLDGATMVRPELARTHCRPLIHSHCSLIIVRKS